METNQKKIRIVDILIIKDKNQNSKKSNQGQGTIKYENGVYEGEIIGEKPQGKGRFVMYITKIKN